LFDVVPLRKGRHFSFTFVALMNVLLKKFSFLLFVLAICISTQAQEHRFNPNLDKYCKQIIKEQFRTISSERKIMLEDIARQLVRKKYILFACKTNSRRTVMLQVWAQTSLYYYGIFGKSAFSVGDTVTGVYEGVLSELSKSGFYCTKQKNTSPNQYVISISEEYPVNLLSSKNEIGSIDTAKGVIVSICSANEQSEIGTIQGHINLPYQSPQPYEKTAKEKGKYRTLNHQIAAEMLYVAEKVKELSVKQLNFSLY